MSQTLLFLIEYKQLLWNHIIQPQELTFRSFLTCRSGETLCNFVTAHGRNFVRAQVQVATPFDHMFFCISHRQWHFFVCVICKNNSKHSGRTSVVLPKLHNCHFYKKIYWCEKEVENNSCMFSLFFQDLQC